MTEQQIIETLATKLMGWERAYHEDAERWGWLQLNPYYFRSSWHPLKNIDDAWLLADKLVLERGIPVEIQSSIREYRVSFNGEDWTYGNTVQEALTKAALLMT